VSEVPHGGQRERVSWLLVAIGVVSVVAGLVLMGSAVAVMSMSDSTSIADAERSLRDAGCTVNAYPAETPSHFRDLEAKVEYNSDPPTNGPHYVYPLPYGRYLEPVNPRQLVHNLEHGGIAIQYGKDVPNATFGQVSEFFREDRNGIVLAPLDKLGNRIALTAWVTGEDVPAKDARFGAGYVALCTDFDEQAFADFRSAFRYHGPESCSSLQFGRTPEQQQRPCFEPEHLQPGL
jgi:hypothetical protein